MVIGLGAAPAFAADSPAAAPVFTLDECKAAMQAAVVKAGKTVDRSAITAQCKAEVAKNLTTENANEILVTGVRGSLTSAAAKKRNAAQILDAIVAEDVGKLPDNNVPEALARVTGVQIDRQHGEGASVTIRGMTDISTTINGQEANTGTDRSFNLADIPSELLKAVEVYKTRSPDQIEGGIAGTVNVEFRRPLDMDKGLTVAGSFRNVFSSIGNTKSPYASLLVADRFDTGIGEMGLLLNGSFTKNNYDETFIESETPGVFNGTDLASLPSATAATTIAPYAANYGTETGRNTRKSLNAVWQWAPSDQLNFVLEGNYISSHEMSGRDRLHLTIRNGNYDLSDVSYIDNGADTQTVDTVTVTPATSTSSIAGGPQSYAGKTNTDTWSGNFETHWHNDHTHIDFSAGYQHSRSLYYGLLTEYRFNSIDSATIDFNSDLVPGGGPYMTFNGVDMSDPSQYYLYNFHEERSVSTSQQFTSQVDLTQDVSDGFFKTFKMGARYTNRLLQYRYGYRDSYPDSDTTLDQDWLGIGVTTTTPDYSGAPTWYHYSASDLWKNLDSIHQWLQTNATTGDWTTSTPSLDLGSGYKSREQTFAVYAMMDYGFKLGSIPVDGNFGARVINTWGYSSSASYSYDDSWNQTISTASGSGNFVDVLPSVTAIAHFTPKLQLRLAYTQNVQRVDFYALSPFRIVQSANDTVYAGNPDLKAYTEKSYDASLEYYFGKGGALTLAGYLKKPKGYIYYSVATEYIPELGTSGEVWTNRNAGGGTFEGIEASGQTFFDFLPGMLSHFGVSANATYLIKGNIDYPDGSDNNAIGMSKYTYNLALLYDTPVFSGRVAYNYRSRYRTAVQADYPEYSPYMDATSRLDAALNYTPFKFITFSLEATNLLKNNARMWWGKDRLVPYGIRYQARTIQLGARFRF
ncbi:TonB-dependent receptor [Novosphingobium sp. 9]|uniref:TonB-dependent receptor n=1 Tax=Novosphingobium sp. 9 TaxID=2025349 RepID=UPI0021B6614D|nr:TonB-dependent receptor [Novosphingobium sp. 9]